MHRVLVTGATGFIGRALCNRILSENWYVRGTTRGPAGNVESWQGMHLLGIGSIGPDTDWDNALEGISTVVHLAAIVHRTLKNDDHQLQDYHLVNVDGTRRLAQAAARKRVRRFIYLSTIKVNGEGKKSAYSELDEPKPAGPYGKSKFAAEQLLRQIASDRQLELVILRPPLVYGPGVKANFLQMLKFVDRRMPLPFSAVQNRRSLIYLGNLVDSIIHCIRHPKAGGQTFIVSDGNDVSTPELIQAISSALGKSARLFPIPPNFLRLLAKAVGKTMPASRLLDSLSVDCTKIRAELDWKPPFSMEDGLRETANWYLQTIGIGNC